MSICIGIRREDKSVWERRTPIIPEHVRVLREKYGLEVWVQPSETRVFSDEEFAQAGARVTEDISPCPIIFGVKEIPPHLLEPHHTYVFFSHVIKGQEYNMPMLAALLEKKCQLIDYEKVTDEHGRRLIFFGRHAGMAGMIDTLWAAGVRLNWHNQPTPFRDLRRAHEYASLAEAQEAIAAAGRRIATEGLPEYISPFVIGFAGYGNVYRGASAIANLLPVEEVAPADLPLLFEPYFPERHKIFTVVFKEEHTVEPLAPDAHFDLQDYYQHPEKYRSVFAQYLPYLMILMNCIYWEPKYPRLVTKAALKEAYHKQMLETERLTFPRPAVIGDISCDIEGAIEVTAKCTEPDSPVFVYDTKKDAIMDGPYGGSGPLIMAVDILPSQLPRESSEYFSGVLLDYIPAIAQADYTVDFDALDLPPEIKRAVIVHHGALTPNYRYLQKYLPH